MGMKPGDVRRCEFLLEESKRGNQLAKHYLKKVNSGEITKDWAYRYVSRRKSISSYLKTVFR
jgi:hypothetical protein